jgi:hypothetical protein
MSDVLKTVTGQAAKADSAKQLAVASFKEALHGGVEKAA